MKAPSTLLLRAMLRPQQPLCQVRWKSEWMPREKYAKITTLDKLHRRQKAAVRKERQDSEDRAAKMFPASTPSATLSQTQQQIQPQQSPPLHQTSFLRSQIQNHNLTPTLSALPYLITRTPSKNLPIYQTTKAGGSKHITTIRKIKGDLQELANAVRTALGLEEYMTDVRGRRKANVVINWTTRHVVVRGWRGPEIKRWAEVSGF
ncbi:uncharacterized protein Z520_01715 [Fonsecaea multimorphosa CBS 102226]|uniref:Large ribosomal subunit protein mL49 n=1 Tax=Fonsecaea multimorphosa CBS 102226 TaxID=1442371 RepID=A0A0D2KB52_9EURO|nr:uncharacterized protein Z520_01715 [Fonsecaea multimorphosa CBS 102226]KIY03248.1 hypothetical protein Z520_01715 [Fonsecaea multimorphosa CBS 102226]OAL30168.1 hypothetical protein AYO22_01684 [Fonsecaea multimorphosa]